jgi:hypothetical protein
MSSCRPETDRGHEYERVDEGVDAAEEIQRGARGVEHRRRGDVAGRQEAERQCRGCGHRGAEHRDLHRRERAVQRGGQHAEVGGQHAAQEVDDPRNPACEPHRVAAGIPHRPRQHQRRDDDRRALHAETASP